MQVDTTCHTWPNVDGLEAEVLKSTLVQVMAWCCKATSHNLSQYWPRYMLPYGVTWPQWVTYLNSTDIAFFTALVIVFGKHKSIINLHVPYLMIIHIKAITTKQSMTKCTWMQWYEWNWSNFFLIKQIFTILDEMIMIIDDNQNKTHIYD